MDLEKLQQLEREQAEAARNAAREQARSERDAAHAQGRAALRTLRARHQATLKRLPGLSDELAELVASEEDMDYEALARDLKATLKSADAFVVALDLAAVDYPDAKEVQALGNKLAKAITSTNIEAMVARYQQQCKEATETAKKDAPKQARIAAALRHGYLDHGDGTVTDTKTGLMWKQFAEGQTSSGSVLQVNWDTAMKIPKDLNFRTGYAGYYDWRLPTKDELFSLVVPGIQSPTICLDAFPGTPAAWFWSSSEYGDNSAWYVNFSDGSVSSNYRHGGGAVRLVRSSQ